ncbi:MAG: hypothetical protein O2944_02440 [Proteobacteria bacterium]|nr:hypothetical protein [Pseudomonadota bacterium]
MKMRIAIAIVIIVTATLLRLAPSAAADKCLHIAVNGGSELLVNKCDQCRVASIIRSRPGNDVPVGRKYNVQPKSTFPMPFRGPGRSRITSDFPCPGEPGGDNDLLNFKPEAKAEQKCVSMERAGSNAIVLINRCGTCRAVAIERTSRGSNSGTRDYFLLAGSSRLPVSPNGFDAVGLVGDISCPG